MLIIRPRILVVLLMLVGTLAAFAVPAHAAGRANVDWSGVPLAFNPDTTTAVVTASYRGDDDLFYEWGRQFRPLNKVGPTPLRFDTSGTGTAEVFSCPPGVEPSTSSCARTGDESPVLTLRREILLGNAGGPVLVGSRVSGKLFMRPQVVDAAIPATWHLKYRYGGPDLYSGPATIISDGISTRYTADLPRSLSGGIFQITVEDYDIPPYGPLDGETDEWPVTMDDWRATPASEVDILYPVVDGYVDSAAISVAVPEDVSGVLAVRDAEGSTVRVLRQGTFAAGRAKVRWDGTRADGSLAPEGDYSIVMESVDSAGNRGQRSDFVRVSHRRLVSRTYSRTVTAAEGVATARVGSCSTLRKSPRRGWPGSALRYHSNATCRGASTSKSKVMTMGRLPVPTAWQGRYGRARLSVHGGAVRGDRSSALRGGFVTADKSTSRVIRFGPRTTTHRTAWVPGRGVVKSSSSGSFVEWTLSATPSSRYDVKNVTVTLSYTVLI